MPADFVVAQGSIIEEITGYDVDQGEATAWLAEHGGYDPQAGTMPEDLTRLLDAYAVPNQMGFHTVDDLYEALARGGKVIVALDADELGGRAVWLTDIGYDAHDSAWKVVLNDPGHEHGRASVVRLADFVPAFADFGGLSVVADPNAYVPTRAPF
jgi:hypothetical protein